MATLLLDFDGPVCNIFAGYPAPVIADQLRQVLADHDIDTPDAVADSNDPQDVLRHSADLGDPELARHVADALRAAEITAVATAQQTPGLPEVLQAAHDSRRRIAVVSNNSIEAVRSYLAHQDLSRHVEAVAARYDGMDPHQLKPSAHLVDLALKELDIAPAAVVLLGDSVSDIQAARAIGVPTIGYANKPGKNASLAAAGADAVITAMTELAHAIHTPAARS